MSDREIMDGKKYEMGNIENSPFKKTRRSKKKKKQQLPDARKHQIVGFVKSIVRIAGYILIPFNLESAVILLILSEIVVRIFLPELV